MLIRKKSNIEEVPANEGTSVSQYFHPHNTLNGISYSLARFTLGVGKKSSLHRLKSSEVYYILEGSAKLYVDNQEYNLGKDDSAYVPPMTKQFIENTGVDELKFLCIVEPAWKQEDEIILSSQ